MFSMTDLEEFWIGACATERVSGASTFVAAAIALRESAGDPLAWHPNKDGSVDRGLWQINSVHETEMKDFGDFRTACYDPQLNARMAVRIWKMQGWDAWSSFSSLP